MAGFKEDTALVKEEYEGLSNSTQILIWSMVAIGVLIGLVLGGAIAYGVAVEEHEGQDCIEYEDDWYCLAEDGAATDDATTDDDVDDDADDAEDDDAEDADEAEDAEDDGTDD